MCFGLVVFYLPDRTVSLGYDINILHFSDDMDKISEGKDPSVFLLDDAEKSKEDYELDYKSDDGEVIIISILDILL